MNRGYSFRRRSWLEQRPPARCFIGGSIRLRLSQSRAKSSRKSQKHRQDEAVKEGICSQRSANAVRSNHQLQQLLRIRHVEEWRCLCGERVCDDDRGQLSVEGLVNKPKVFDLDELLKFPLEERIYRLRCVEGWSMVIPWVGFPSAVNCSRRSSQRPQARYVAFQTLLDPKRMPNQRTGILDWPYVEGLRLDEAMHPLTIMATGMYDETLPPQDGAPIRLVVPWKYGFKSIKSVVKITLVADEPPTTWNIQAPDEYGFYSNVNPNVPHPRWSQATERRIGEYGRRNTLLFNGYGEQVAHLVSRHGSGEELLKLYD